MKTIKQMAKYIAKVLIKNGFIVQRLNAVTTNSIYLKLDYGMCNSIRISDHKGLSKYSYRYNILQQLPDKTYQYFENGKFPRAFYSFDMENKLIADILKNRQAKIQQYGEFIYSIMQEKNKQENVGKAGFWQKSQLLK